MTRLRTALLLAALSLALAACSDGLGLTLSVPDFEVPAPPADDAIVCYVRVENESPVSVAAARYDATATFVPDGFGTATTTVRIYGRPSAPAASCVPVGASSERALSGAIELVAGEATEVTVGEGEYGRTLASLVRSGDFWIGAAIENFNLGTDARIEFTDGRITVAF